MFARMNLGQLGIFGRLSLIVAALAIPFTALCVWMILQLAQFARDDQRASLIYAARSISAAVDAQLGIIDTLGQVLSNSPALLNDDLPAFEQEVRRTIAPGSDSWAMVADLQGQQLLNTALPAGQPLPVRSARGLVAQRKAFATHHSIVSEVLKGTATNVWIATIDVPIFKDGKPFRELVVSMDVKFFAGLLNAQNLPNGWRAAIVDSSDRFVALEPLRFGPGDRAVSYWREGATRGDSFEYVSRGGSRLVGSAVKSATGSSALPFSRRSWRPKSRGR